MEKKSKLSFSNAVDNVNIAGLGIENDFISVEEES